MIFFCNGTENGFRQADLQGLYDGLSAWLVGGAPSLLKQNYRLLEQRGILRFGMNNVPALLPCQYMVCSDDPRCFDRRLLLDPTICKLMNIGYAQKRVRDGESLLLRDCPNVLFFETDIPHDDSRLFLPTRKVNWKRNSLFLSISLMAYLGIRRIYLAGSDFGPADRGNPDDPNGQYSVGASLASDEREWNNLLYKYEIQDLIKLRPVFAEAGLEIVDTSASSKVSTAWRTMSIDKAVEECLRANRFPEAHDDPKTLPHVSRLFPASLKEQVVAGRYTVVDEKDSIYGTRPVTLQAGGASDGTNGTNDRNDRAAPAAPETPGADDGGARTGNDGSDGSDGKAKASLKGFELPRIL